MVRLLVIVNMIVFFSVSACAQTGKDSGHPQDNPNIIKDVFKGVILNDGQNITTVLTLDHLIYADDGDFTLVETFRDAKNKEQTAKSFGEWTVLRGDAKDENATVVELDAPQRILYFLRLRNGNLQKLDTSLRVIIPTARYILRKEGNQLAGTYTGKRPLTGCSVETTLNLECGVPCHEGDYTLSNKYIGTPKGAAKSSKSDSRKGKWEIPARRGMTDTTFTMIVLDPDKAGKETYYKVKDDGGLLPLDSYFKQAYSPIDGTLERK